MPGRILIIDDEEQLRKLLMRIISLEGFTILEAGSLAEANQLLKRQEPDLVLCDVKLPDGNGVDFVKTVKANHPLIEIILLTAYGNIPDGVQAMKNGAFDYLVKGDDNNKVLPLIYQAIDKVNHQRQSAIKVDHKHSYDFSSIIGESSAIKNAVTLARKVANTDATLLLLGETGTGKEVFANAIHYNSGRNKRSLIAINCSAFTKELLEAELFGYKAGAYTGATKDKKGLIEMADGGTLFLDEIGEMNIDLQAKLLRVLENGEFIKLGDTKVSKANVRLIAATNRDLRTAIGKGEFREDLYYRLNVFTIELPALRERAADIPFLVNYFLQQFAAKQNKTSLRVSNDAMQLLQQYNWKGNIRELKNVLERAVILVDGNEVLPEHLPYEIQKQNTGSSQQLSLAAVERMHIQKILQSTNGNKASAARLLEIGLATLYRKMEEYGLSSPVK